MIPRSILENAKGFAIFTVFKAGFLFSARAGSGIVIAKLPDGSECSLCCAVLHFEGHLFACRDAAASPGMSAVHPSC